MDVHTKKQRSYNMSRIQGKNTKPEIKLRQWLWNNGYRYRLHYNKLPGKPDIVFPGKNKVIFVHGCFWHKHNCRYFQWPDTNKDFWRGKIKENTLRDKKNYKSLSEKGWKYIVMWECELRKTNYNVLSEKIKQFYEG